MNNATLRFSAVGDISLGDHPLCAGIGAHSKFRNINPNFPFQKVQNEFNKADVLFGNLECTLSTKGLEKTNYHSIQMRGQPGYITGLVNAGFDVLNLANNHSMQHGEDTFKETIDILNEHKIKYCGVSDNFNDQTIPGLVEKNNLKISFLGYSLRPRQYFEQQPLYTEGTASGIKDDILRIKEKVDIVIVSLHWGDEFIDHPSPEEIKLAHEIIDSGANLVIGHHPHVLRGIEQYKNGYIVYSLGNFVCDMSWDESLRQTMIFSCDLSSTGINNVEYTPAYINNDFQPELLSGKEKELMLNKINLLSENISTNTINDFSAQSREYINEADKILCVIRKKSQKFFLRRLWSYPKIILFQQLLSYFRNRFHELIH